MSFASFWKRNLAFVRLAALSNLEYRFNYLTDAILQPLLTALIELTLWTAVFASISGDTIGGFPKSFYLSYAVWAAFVARITANWMYEFRMIEEVDRGTINSVLARPIGFSEYYLSQFLGYKLMTTLFSLCIPIAIELFSGSPERLLRVPAAICLTILYLVFAHLISLSIASFAFFLNRAYSFTVAKNLLIWLLSGELFPLDLAPEPFRHWLLLLPFSSAVYVPVGYLTGRIGTDVLSAGFLHVAVGICIMWIVSSVLWKVGLRKYSGTGA